MTVAVDAQLTVGTATGIGAYVRGLHEALRAAGEPVIALRDEKLDPWRFDRRLLWDQMVLPRRAAGSGAHLLHCASGTMPLRSSLPAVVTVHDLAWTRVQAHAPWYARRYFGSFSLHRYRSARAIMTDSQFSRSEVLAALPDVAPERVVVVTPGVSAEFSAVERRPDRQTILVVGTVEPRKNLAFLIALLPRLPNARLVSVGPATPYVERCRALARELGVETRVELAGYVPADRIRALYATAAVAAVPSTYEGFGYAVAQALCAGLPCVCSDRTSLPEVSAGDASALSLGDAAAWIAALEASLAGARDDAAAAVRDRSVARFSWARAAAEVSAVYRTALRSVDG